MLIFFAKLFVHAQKLAILQGCIILEKKIKMEPKKIIPILFTVVAVMLTSSFAQAQQSAIVKGKIRDKVTREVLPGATVQVVGGYVSVSSDVNGDFTLYTTAGNLALKVKYLGYSDSTLNIQVEPNSITTLNLFLTGKTNQLTAVLIAGQLQGQAKALNQQKNADNIKNVVAADQISRFPDPNAAEALQRVPGVNIERDQGEGRYVLVRGLAPQFTNINVNGEQIPSPEADVRYVALDVVPADQLSSIEVSKSLTPDMDGDAIGGSINLITRTAQGGALQSSGSIIGGYNSLMQRPNLQGQLQVSKRFGKEEKLGIMLNGNYYHNDLGSDNWERNVVDNEVELRDYELTRTRAGLSTTIDYKFNQRNEVYFRSLYSKFTDREWRRRYVFLPNDDEIEKLTKDRFEAQSIFTNNIGAKHTFKRFYTNYEVQYSYGEQDTPYDNEAAFIAGVPSTIDYSDKNFPKITTATPFTNNSLYEFDEAEFGSTIAKDQNVTAKIDFGVPYKLAGNEGVIKFGVKARSKDKSYSINANKYANLGGVPTLDAFEESAIKEEFLDGQYDLGNPLNINELITYFNANPNEFELQVEDKAIDEALESFEAEEDVLAAYLMAKQQFKKLMVIAGLRFEQTKVSYTSQDVIIGPTGDLEQIRSVSGDNDYTFILPQFQLRYALNDFTNVRASATYSYARPNFSEIIPAQEINREDNVASVGNPNLKPVSALNLDFMLEHYFGNVGVISAGVFHKQLDDFIYRRVIFNTNYPLAGTPIATGIDVTQSQNGNDADLTGFELNIQRNLSFLPGALKYFSVYANYTYTSSNATIQSREASNTNPNSVETIRLPGQATHVGNVSLAFERKKVSLRAALNFNGEYLSEVGGVPAEDLYVSNRMQLDLSGSYTIHPKIRVFAEVLNVTNQPFETYQGNSDTYVQREFYSWWSRVGVKFNL